MVLDPGLPSAADYNLMHYKGTSYQQLQGGAPNNILVLKRAVKKQQEKQSELNSTFNTSKVINQSTTLDGYTNIGPGAYSPEMSVQKRNKGVLNQTFSKSLRF